MEISSQAHVIRQNIQNSDHLAEDENAVPIRFELSEKFVEQDHFAGTHDEAFERFLLVVGANLRAIE